MREEREREGRGGGELQFQFQNTSLSNFSCESENTMRVAPVISRVRVSMTTERDRQM